MIFTIIDIDFDETSEGKRLKAKANFEKFEKERLERMAKQLQRKQIGIEKERIKMADIKRQMELVRIHVIFLFFIFYFFID
jgi:hypothetical protein